MLDELKEFKEYTKHISDGSSEKKKTLRMATKDAGVVNLDPLLHKHSKGAKKHAGEPSLSGIERPLTIIARGILFESFDDDLEKNIKRATAALRMWCGLVPKKIEDETVYEYLRNLHPDLENWLKKYVKIYDSDNYDIMCGALEKKRGIYGHKVFDMKGSLNQISYEKIIANALISGGALGTNEDGSLKKYYLAGKNKNWIEGISKEDKNGTVKLSDKDLDRILKLTVAIMMGNKKRGIGLENLTYHYVNHSALSLWIGQRLSGNDYKKYHYKGAPLFEFDKLFEDENDKRYVVKPNDEWFEKSGWEIIDATYGDNVLDRYLEENPEAVFYSDNIPGQLRKNEKYI